MSIGKSSTTLHGDNAAWPTAPALEPTKAESMSVMIGFAAKMPSAGAANLMTLARSVSEGGGGGSDAAAAPNLVTLLRSDSDGGAGASDAPLLAGSATEAAQRTAARRRRGAIRQHSSGRAVGRAQPRVAVDAQRSPRTREPPAAVARGATQCSVMALGIPPAALRFRGGALRWQHVLSSRLYVLRTPAVTGRDRCSLGCDTRSKTGCSLAAGLATARERTLVVAKDEVARAHRRHRVRGSHNATGSVARCVRRSYSFILKSRHHRSAKASFADNIALRRRSRQRASLCLASRAARSCSLRISLRVRAPSARESHRDR